MVLLGILLLWALASMALAFGISLAVHGTDGKTIWWNKFGPAVLLICISACWFAMGVGLGVKFL